VTAIRKKFPDFFDYSNKNLFSFDLGYHKPDKNIYVMACDIIGFTPHDCIFLDDSLKNVLGARNIGLGAFPFIPENYTMINKLAMEYMDG
jgi:HAD superfamily hydrolase (TIGR01509 family)